MIKLDGATEADHLELENDHLDHSQIIIDFSAVRAK